MPSPEADPPARSPLTGSEDVLFVRAYRASDVAAMWKRVMGIDVLPEFRGRETFSLHRCPRTGLLFFWPPALEGSPALYAALGRFPWYSTELHWEHRRALRLLRPGSRVLEIGCARGLFLQAARKRGCDARGVDTDAEAVREARSRGQAATCEDASAVAAREPRTYDAVCAFQVLEHVAQPLPFLQSAVDLLKPGGLLLIGVPDADGYFRLRDIPLDLPPHHMLRWSEESLRSLEGFLPLALERVRREPLAADNIGGYLLSQAHAHGVPSRARRLLLHPRLQAAYRPLLRVGGRRLLRGHTLLAVFRRCGSL